jgi:hypothetical protein
MPAEAIKKGFQAMSLRRLPAVLMLAFSAGACAHQDHQDKAAPPAPAAPKAPEAAAPAETPENAPHPVMDQRALDLLKRMSDTLASAKSFTYRSRSSVEEPAATGQFLTFFGETQLALQRPNKLRAKVGGDLPDFQIAYDGAKVWAFDPGKNLYAVAEAPGNIDDTLKFLMDKAGVHFPASDFMVSNPYATMTQDVNSAFVVGTSQVDGHPTDHLAFMGPGVNWEIWIDRGKEALPRRFAVTYKEATNFPRFLVEFFDWRLNPKLPASEFAFKAPRGAKPIEFASQVGQEFQKPAEGGK